MWELYARGLDLSLKVAQSLRKKHKTIVGYDKKSLKNHLKQADKQNARYIVAIGEDELKDGTIWIKDLDKKEEKTLKADSFSM